MAATTTAPRPSGSVFLLVLMAIFHLLILCPSAITAAPATRSGRLIMKQYEHGVEDQAEEGAAVMKLTAGLVRRTAVELNDYPGSGANNRHTPRQQFGRCVDC
ncbi:hypothetical protein LINPERPRIM_LOCUS28663 [Linum perenne]